MRTSDQELSISPSLVTRLARELGALDVEAAVLRDSFGAFRSYWNGTGLARVRTTDQHSTQQLSYTFLGRPARDVPAVVTPLMTGVRALDQEACDRLDALTDSVLRDVYGAMWLGSDFEVDVGLVKHYLTFSFGLDVDTLGADYLARILPASVQESAELLRRGLPYGIHMMAVNYRARAVSFYGIVNEVESIAERAREAFPDVDEGQTSRFLAELEGLRPTPHNQAFTFGFDPDRLARCACYVSTPAPIDFAAEGSPFAGTALARLPVMLRAAHEEQSGREFTPILGWSFGGPRGFYRKVEVATGRVDVRRSAAR